VTATEPQAKPAHVRPTSSPNFGVSLSLGIVGLFFSMGVAHSLFVVLLGIAALVTCIVGFTRDEPHRAIGCIGLILAVCVIF
jgi:hypothetical protein